MKPNRAADRYGLLRRSDRAIGLGFVTLVPKRASASRSSGEWNDDYWSKMTPTELIIQLLKVAIGGADEIATDTGFYSACAHATDGKPARHAQSSYATHP